MFCPNCGNYNEDAKFCSECGTPLVSDDASGFSVNNGQYQNPSPDYNSFEDVEAWDYDTKNEQSNYHKINYDQPGDQQSGYQQSNYQPYNPQPYTQQQPYMGSDSWQSAQPVYTNTSGQVPGKAAGITSLVMGILSLLFCCIPILGFVFAVVGTITGIVSIVKSNKVGAPSGLGIGGLICSIIGLLIGLVYMVGIMGAVFEIYY